MFRLLTAACFLLGDALAQTPPGLSPSTRQNFSVEYSNKSFTAGQLLKTSDVAQQPSIGTFNPLNGTYTLLMMDPDGFYEGANTTVLHWLQTDLVVASTTSASSEGVYPLTSTVNASTSTLAAYSSPAPPLQVPAVYHHYTLLLFSQTNSELTISPSLNSSMTYRIGFNLSDFIATSGLGPLVAAAYFELVNTTTTSNSSVSNGTKTTSGSVPISTGGSSSVMGAGVGYLGWPAATFALSFAALHLM